MRSQHLFAVMVGLAALPLTLSCNKPVDPMVEGLACADIADVWRKRSGLNDDSGYFRGCALGYEAGRIVRASIVAITESSPARKSVECWNLILATQAVAESNAVTVRGRVSDYDDDFWIYGEAECVVDGNAG